MTSNARWKVIFVLVVLVLAVWRSSYTFRFLSLDEAGKEQMTEEQFENLKANSLSLGLDLQGGMHVVLEVDKAGLPADEAKDVMERAVEIITNRIDQFGVAEPSIQTEGDNRIIVQLPGLKDEQRAKRLIGRTALLEFMAVAPPAETDIVLRAIDRALVDVLTASGELPSESETGLPLTEAEQLEREHPFSIHARYLQQLPFFLEEDMTVAKEQLERIDLDKVLPADPNNLSKPRYGIAWGQEARQFGTEEKFWAFYVLEKEAILTGAAIASADVRPGLDQDNPNAPGVSMKLSRSGGRTFAKHTGSHIGEYLAVVLDGAVYKAPIIKSRIPAGTPTSITGGFSDDEAKDLAIILRAGKLPAPMKVIEERTVGPSLGRDSIKLGLRAMAIGFILVVIFMLVYYKASGAIAVAALAANILIVIGIMATLPVNPRPALTLPGLAGLILTIGMAVDANVLIFERIREELRNGKTIRAAIRDGYERAFTTIMDANVTTLIAAAVLLRFGSGPVKGFGVTLSLGILASMFTAIVATRVVFDLITVKWNIKNLSI